MNSIMYVGPFIDDEIDRSEYDSILFLSPLVEDLVKFYTSAIAESNAIEPLDSNTYCLRIELIERLLEFHPHIPKLATCKGFALPSFFELAENIYYQDKALLLEPNITSALVFLTRNIVQRFCELKPLALLISETTLHKLSETGSGLLYGYKDMFVIESYGYIAEACDTVLILYVKNLRNTSKIIEKILTEAPNLILSVDLVDVASQGIPLSILELHKSKTLNIDFAIALELGKEYISEDEKRTLERLYNFYNGRLGIVLKNSRPLVLKPVRVDKDALHRYVHNIIAYLSAS
jgi:hypothetical protein